MGETGNIRASSDSEDAVNKQGRVILCYILNTAIFTRFSAFFNQIDLQDGDTSGFSSTRVIQTTNCVYCCPDQETGKVLTSDDWTKRPYSGSGYYPS